MSLDPHAVDYPSLSDYVYVGGNPISFIDPDGKDFVDKNGERMDYRIENGEIHFSLNANKDYQRLVKAIYSTKSKTALKSFNRANNSQTKINFKIINQKRTMQWGDRKRPIEGLTNPHDKDGNMLDFIIKESEIIEKGVKKNKIETGYSGNPAYIDNKDGTFSYKEVTITLDEAWFDYAISLGFTKFNIDEKIASVFGHEEDHGTNSVSVTQQKEYIEGDKPKHNAETPAEEVQRKIEGEF